MANKHHDFLIALLTRINEVPENQKVCSFKRILLIMSYKSTTLYAMNYEDAKQQMPGNKCCTVQHAAGIRFLGRKL